MQIYKARKSSH